MILLVTPFLSVSIVNDERDEKCELAHAVRYEGKTPPPTGYIPEWVFRRRDKKISPSGSIRRHLPFGLITHRSV